MQVPNFQFVSWRANDIKCSSSSASKTAGWQRLLNQELESQQKVSNLEAQAYQTRGSLKLR